MSKNEENAKDHIVHWSNIGSNFVGSAVSGIIGVVNPTMEGAIVAAAVGTVVGDNLQIMGQEMRNRFLSKKEETRIGTSYFYLLEKFNENISEGKKVRDDNFFDAATGEYNRNQEILEGVLIISQKSYEDKKVRYISYFYANILFEKRWDTYHANHFLRLAEGMSYRQFCLLAVYCFGSEFGLDKGNYSPTSRVIRYDTISDLLSLKDKAFLGLTLPLTSGDGKTFMFPPENAFLSEYGLAFCELFGLFQIPLEDILEVAGHLITPEKIEEIRKKGLS